MNRKLFLMAAVGVTMLLGYSAQTAMAHGGSRCNSCHVPHNAAGDNSEVPLWNPAHTTTTLDGNYNAAEGGTLNATLSGPNGASKLCLSCHDGSYDHVSAAHSFTGEVGSMGGLANSHPISFVYDAALVAADGGTGLKDPTALKTEGVLDGMSQVQCTSCHEVHDTDSRQDVNNLRWAYPSVIDNGDGTTSTISANAGPFCMHCHNK
ncbi:MAG: hypothetical protein WD042_16645 [Phycisphaeraceae bacterium]